MTELDSTLKRLAADLRHSAAALRENVKLLQRAEQADAEAEGRPPPGRDDIAARGGDVGETPDRPPV